MTITIKDWLRGIDDDRLYKHFNDVIDEMNRRKTIEMQKAADAKNLDFENMEVN